MGACCRAHVALGGIGERGKWRICGAMLHRVAGLPDRCGDGRILHGPISRPIPDRHACFPGWSEEARAHKREALRRVLLRALRYQDDVWYYQGLHDVAAVLLFTLGEAGAASVLSQLVVTHLRDATRQDLLAATQTLGLLYPLLCVVRAWNHPGWGPADMVGWGPVDRADRSWTADSVSRPAVFGWLSSSGG